MDASQRGYLLNKLADLMERDRTILAVSLNYIKDHNKNFRMLELLRYIFRSILILAICSPKFPKSLILIFQCCYVNLIQK
uniref:Uncharacterized protein n=1 Tax=Heterorhabditis bacteriophora TaxID=37862 RepID=A0A1I7X391_HETBA